MLPVPPHPAHSGSALCSPHQTSLTMPSCRTKSAEEWVGCGDSCRHHHHHNNNNSNNNNSNSNNINHLLLRLRAHLHVALARIKLQCARNGHNNLLRVLHANQRSGTCLDAWRDERGRRRYARCAAERDWLHLQQAAADARVSSGSEEPADGGQSGVVLSYVALKMK